MAAELTVAGLSDRIEVSDTSIVCGNVVGDVQRCRKRVMVAEAIRRLLAPGFIRFFSLTF